MIPEWIEKVVDKADQRVGWEVRMASKLQYEDEAREGKYSEFWAVLAVSEGCWYTFMCYKYFGTPTRTILGPQIPEVAVAQYMSLVARRGAQDDKHRA